MECCCNSTCNSAHPVALLLICYMLVMSHVRWGYKEEMNWRVNTYDVLHLLGYGRVCHQVAIQFLMMQRRSIHWQVLKRGWQRHMPVLWCSEGFVPMQKRGQYLFKAEEGKNLSFGLKERLIGALTEQLCTQQHFQYILGPNWQFTLSCMIDARIVHQWFNQNKSLFIFCSQSFYKRRNVFSI